MTSLRLPVDGLESAGTTRKSDQFAAKPRLSFRGLLVTSGLVFAVSFLILFLGMSRRPNLFDEGIVLTAAMRVAAGQIPHRDFYALYGPAQFYILAGLFKVFGWSLLVERLFDVFGKALGVTAVYAIASMYCRRWLAASASACALLWLFSFNRWPGSPIPSVSFLNLIGCAIVLPLFTNRTSAVRIFAAGAIAGLAGLFRYDTGIALFAVQGCVISFAIYLRSQGPSRKLRTFAAVFGVYLAGFALVIVPPAIYYFLVAPAAPLIHDMFLYPARYYHRGRNLPFPGINRHVVENLGIYLPVLIALLSLYVGIDGAFVVRNNDGAVTKNGNDLPAWRGVLVTFGILTVAMYLKGYVRVTLFQLSLAIIPSLLLIAVLVQHQSILPVATRLFTRCLAFLSVLAVASAGYHEAKGLYLTHLSVAEYVLAPSRFSLIQTQSDWCKFPGPVPQPFCFLPEDDRIHAVEFIDRHTRQGDTLYSGLPRHDRVFAADNVIYFATQRLPASRWSELDPDLESRADVQKQMVQELEVAAPPYIVLDSEFEKLQEPNDSSRSSGVVLLDDYILKQYRQIETYGVLTIWQRRTDQ